MEVWRVLFWLIILMNVGDRADGNLVENFYNSTCPEVEAIVQNVTATIKSEGNFAAVPKILRLFFHDCFVEGCDASIMIESQKNDTEKYHEINHSLVPNGFEVVIKAKKAVEAVCPGIVSCADIMAIATRDVLALVGGPSFRVELGRRDGLISDKTRVEGNIPHASFNLNSLTNSFANKNLTQLDMIALSGAHTIGFSHCRAFRNRLYPNPDPSLNITYAKQLMLSCPENNTNPDNTVAMDPESPTTFDNLYYKNLINGLGLFTSDEVLFTDPESKYAVLSFASQPGWFAKAFAAAMVKLGRVGVKSGNQGEIRKDCTAFNPWL